MSRKARSADCAMVSEMSKEEACTKAYIHYTVSSVLKLFIPHIDGLQAYDAWVAGGVKREATLNSI